MEIKDKNLNIYVNVCGKECFERECYWIRPGIFTPGKGHKTRGSAPSKEYICGTRAIHGCPDKYCF